MLKENYYEILKLKNFSSSEDIRSKYKDLIKINHPDKGGKQEDFERIKRAYEFLKSEEAKFDYDKKLKCIILKIIWDNFEIIEKSEILEKNEYEIKYHNNNKEIKKEIMIIEFSCKQCFSQNSSNIKKVILFLLS